MAKTVQLASQVELTVLTREEAVVGARIGVRYATGAEGVALLTATEMDALVEAWQRERRKVILRADERSNDDGQR